jgi:hypothetical protein
MDFPVELVELLKHADVECKLIWIKAEKPIDTIGEVASQATKKKYLSPSTRKRNSRRLYQRKAKRNQAIVDI